MELKLSTDPITGDIRFHGQISQCDIQRANLDGFDLALLRDCDPSKDDVTAADLLLALEMLFRKVPQ